MNTVFLYAGQGSQYYHMGQTLYAGEPVFHRHMKLLDEALQPLVGESLLKRLYAPEVFKAEPFDDTVTSSLALFMVERAITEMLAAEDCHPDAVVGVSMGCFAALCASGQISESSMLPAVVKQAEVMAADCEEGAMLGVLAHPDLYEQCPELSEFCELAAINGSSHFVIALPRSALTMVEACLARNRIPFQRMPVSRAYHSCWIDPAKEGCIEAFSRLPCGASDIPAELCIDNAYVADSHPLWEAMRQPMQWCDAIIGLEQRGPCRYIDLSPSGTLATLLKYLLPSTSRSTTYSTLTPMGNDAHNLDQLRSAMRSREKSALC
jgi:acyl transferase domain-containing protein